MAEVSLSAKEHKFKDIGLVVGSLDDPRRFLINTSVLDPQGRPLNDSVVTITSPFASHFFKICRTNKIGRCAIEIDPPGQFIVAASKSGFATGLRLIILPSGIERPTCDLEFKLSTIEKYRPEN